jgi:hypothetical protein
VVIATPRPLFGLSPLSFLFGAYDVGAGSQRFLAVLPEQTAPAEPSTVLLNWTTALKK